MKRAYKPCKKQIVRLFAAACAVLAAACSATARAETKGAGADMFSRGAGFWEITAGRSFDDRLGMISLAQCAIGHYIRDRLAVHYGAAVGYAATKRTQDGFLAGPVIGARWHFIEVQRWSLFLDGSAGAIYHEHPVKEDTLRFNFDLQAGAGTTFRTGSRTALQGGFSWHHLSNGRIRGKSYNYGYDGPMVYLGVIRAL